MKRYGLVLTTLGTLFITGMTLYTAGWFGTRTAQARSPQGSVRQAAVQKEENTSSIPAYYRQAGPRHWRDCLGQN